MRSILLVQIGAAGHDALVRRLRQSPYAVTVALNDSATLYKLAHDAYDMVIIDATDAGVALDLLTRIRARHSREALPVIVVTSASELVVEALAHGANDYLTAPVDLPLALARIDMQLAHQRAVERLRETEERYELAVHGANDGLWDWNLVTGDVYWSPRWRSILGLGDRAISADAEEWLSRIHPDDRVRVETTLKDHLSHGSGHYQCEHRVRRDDETYRWVRCRGAAVRNDAGVATRFAGSLTDITDTKLADALTGLPNRLLFLDVVERALKRVGPRRPEYGFAILVLSLDRFRIIHDSLGPSASDRLLVAVARRLQAALRATDVVTRDEPGLTLARNAGDEFTVLVDEVADASSVTVVAERLRQALEAPFEVDEHRLFVSARIGIAVSHSGYTRADDILRDATIALNRAARNSGVPYEIFDPGMRQRAMARLAMETDLRHAIERQQFEVHYQPIIELATGRIAGFEALARWQHPDRGLILPAEFIGVAEDTGVIADIDRLTLTDACRQMSAWMGMFGPAAPAMVSANLSVRQLGRVELLTQIASTLRTTGLPPGSLKIEITENAFIEDMATAQRILDRARELGVSWSLDDFGTGYSSLSLLHRLRIDTLKVDRSFVSAIGQGGAAAEMVRAIVGLAHTLGMDVVAEGVETAEQAAEVRGLGCEFAQGFYYSRAVDAAAARRLIEEQPWQRNREQHLVQ